MGGGIQQWAQIGIGRQSRELDSVDYLAGGNVQDFEAVEIAQGNVHCFLVVVHGNGTRHTPNRNLGNVFQCLQINHLDLPAFH